MSREEKMSQHRSGEQSLESNLEAVSGAEYQAKIDQEEKHALDQFAAELMKVVDNDGEFFVQNYGSDEDGIYEDEDQNVGEIGMSFEAQLARLNASTGKELEKTLEHLERQLQGLEPLEEYEDADDDDPYAYVRDGVSHSMTRPASIEEWRTAYPELCVPGSKLFILGPGRDDDHDHGEFEKASSDDFCKSNVTDATQEGKRAHA
mmetsp:Transcript_13697/g.26508  ORF Transcript_13697/g.26508 Transcript_13697/m.26508 type:complete len:205 (-) Transcript_13697:202-816(-)|eukprot:CAMPEP_0171525374 /NCGR_PEP_ID=MMETSP0959-20130129/9675_1 /TAXON_ID=87120 /ORGANISM="Aurantiochytrium limacinum, Strain ATCCMYA-1381" /LENGTH=204 /DNA_ID=CAMNT_0012066425 /DNA_START=83 /DNA_END=697 /DNA_ORIENTATION=+